MHEKIDIVIPVHNAKEFTQQCVESVIEHTNNFRFIFVDDYSDAEATEYLRWLAPQHPSALLLRTNKQKWFTRASNLGLRLVNTPKAVLLNSDCIVRGNWLGELLDVWAELEGQGKKIGLVGSVHDEQAAPRYVETKEPNYVTGHCLMFNMQAIYEVSANRGTPGWYLNERDAIQVHINSDRILCYDLNKLGYITVAAYKAPCGHYGGKSWHYDMDGLARKVPHLGVLD